jgi:hypothetical protein
LVKPTGGGCKDVKKVENDLKWMWAWIACILTDAAKRTFTNI